MKRSRCSTEKYKSAAVEIDDDGDFCGRRRETKGAEDANEGFVGGIERNVFGERSGRVGISELTGFGVWRNGGEQFVPS